MEYLVLYNLDVASESRDWAGAVTLCPRPQELTFHDGALALQDVAGVILGDAEATYLLDQLNDELAVHGHAALDRLTSPQKMAQYKRELGLADWWEAHEVTHPEGYTLYTRERALVILAKTRAGLFYGLQTLYQLLVPGDPAPGATLAPEATAGHGTLCVPRVEIVDFPSMAIRGISNDISRGQSPRLSAEKRHIRFLSRFKLNTYMYYIEDTFAIRRHPYIGEGRGPLTPAMVRELEAYAARYHVEIVPIYQTLGHMENMLRLPELVHLADFPGSACLNLADPAIYPFLEDLITEVSEGFASPSVHIGCDETWDVGVYGSKDLVAEKGMDHALLDHYLWVIDQFKARGKEQFFMYEDIASKYPVVLEGLRDTGMILVMWDYSPRDHYPRIDTIKGMGLPFVVSSSVLSWVRVFPDWPQSMEANFKLIQAGVANGAIGQINSSWGDNGQENLRENHLLGFAYSSALSWNLADWDDETFVTAFFHAMLGFSGPKVHRLYELLASIPEEFPWRFRTKYLGFLWRHPYPKQYMDETMEEVEEYERWTVTPEQYYHADDMEALKPLCNEIVTLVDELKPRVTRDETLLDYFAFAARLLRYFVDKIQATARVTTLCNAGLTPAAVSEIEGLVLPIIATTKVLRAEFERLWLHCAGRPMLDRILRFYDWQVYWQEQKLAQVRAGVPWQNPYVPSEWIAHAEPDRTQEPRYFRHEFTIDPADHAQVERAHFQLGPGNYAELWLNGTRVGSAQCSPHLGAPIIDHLLEVWDVHALLRPGKNVVAIKGVNYLLGTPVVNLYGELALAGGATRTVLTDPTWKTRAEEVPGWTALEFDAAGWQPAESKGRPPKYMGEISLPRFDVGWKSKTSHAGYARILRAKATEGPVSEFFDDFYYFSGNIL